MKKNALFFSSYAIFATVLLCLLLTNSKAGLHLWMTSEHNAYSDFFFKYYTELGGWVPFLIAFFALFYKVRTGILICMAQLFTGLVTQVAKLIWNEPRPRLYFEKYYPTVQLHHIQGMDWYSNFSFPSGHTTAAFSLFLVLTLATDRKYMHLIYLFLAVLVGYSRIYLSQHFAIDVLVGSAIGVVFTYPCKFWVDRWTFAWLDAPLFLKNRSRA